MRTEGNNSVNEASSNRWIDVTLPLADGLPAWPGDPPFRRTPVCTVEADGAGVSRIEMSSHSGTHVDAPRHFFADGRPVDALDPEQLMGPCLVVEAHAPDGRIGRALLEGRGIEGCTRVLVRSRDPKKCAPLVAGPGTGHLDGGAATWLVAQGVRLVAIDSLSIDAFDSHDYPAHRALLGAGVIVIEGLDLTATPPGAYDLVALPLRLAGADGAPARVLVRPHLP